MGINKDKIMSEIKKILFYLRKEKNGEYSNFWRAKQIINHVLYDSNEHYYQSEKTNNSEIKDWIISAPSAWLAMNAGQSIRRKNMVVNWNTIKRAIMLKGLRAKFNQNPLLSEKLLLTGNATIHEDSPTDMFWGVKGKDVLGKLLMQVREELKIVKLENNLN